MVTTSTSIDTPSISVIGAGRVGSALARALHARHYRIASVWSRTEEHAAELAAEVKARAVSLLEAASQAELALLAVPDDRLPALVAELAAAGAWRSEQLVVHVSGVLPANVLTPAAEHRARIGGFHPLAAISRRDQILAPGISFAIEAGEPLHSTLWSMAESLGGMPFDLLPEHRPLYHAAAVLASNYTVVLAALAAELLERAGVEGENSLRALLPLLHSTLDNLENVGLPRALTGPLVRGDAGTIMRHLTALDTTAPEVAEVYRALAVAALPLVAAQGQLDPMAMARIEAAIGSRMLEPLGLAGQPIAPLASTPH